MQQENEFTRMTNYTKINKNFRNIKCCDFTRRTKPNFVYLFYFLSYLIHYFGCCV